MSFRYPTIFRGLEIENKSFPRKQRELFSAEHVEYIRIRLWEYVDWFRRKQRCKSINLLQGLHIFER